MFCEKCGNKLADDDVFCSVCGAKVKQDSSIPKSSVTRGMGYGYNDFGENSEKKTGSGKKQSKRDDIDIQWEKEEKKEKITFMILGVIIVLLVVAIVAGVIFLVKSGKNTENESVPQLNQQMKEEMEQSKSTVTPEITQKLQEEEVQVTEEVTPEVTEEVTPVPTEEVTPVPTEEAVPVPTQEVTPVPTQAPVAASDEYIISDSSTRYLTNADLNPLSEWEIRVARNEIFARHGRIFKSEDLASYYGEKSWYVPSIPPEQFDNSYLNAIEIENLKFITNYEKAHNMNQ